MGNVPGFPNYYVTRDGQLFKDGKPCKLYFHKGYLRTMIHYKGKKKNIKIHRLVAEIYIPNPENKPLVRHLNDDRFDNRVENLAWGTDLDNRNDALRNGKITDLKGKNNPMYGRSFHTNPNAKLSKDDLFHIEKLAKQGYSARYIHETYYSEVVCEATIHRNIHRMKTMGISLDNLKEPTKRNRKRRNR